ncbi:MAG: glucosyltransferase domain-containing protein, partial [Holosporaceae bacterium]|nr:glucosyltransferase domain-containing protein [Holosporaceae bacterium]
MASGSPYNDDFCRYISNFQVGFNYNRHGASFLEILSFFSFLYSYDTVPFFSIISCAILACIAIICKKILDIVHKWEYASNKYIFVCLIPIVVNPYLVEVMIFRFDNLFITIALLCSTGAAYFSAARNYCDETGKSETNHIANIGMAKWIFIQLWLLLFSLLVYQAAFSAYIVVFTYVLLVNLSKNKRLSQIASEMRHWIYSMLLSLGSYIPFATTMNAEKIELKSAFSKEMPRSIQEVTNNTIANICNYSRELYNDWSVNAAGLIFFVLSICFVLTFLIDTWENIKSKPIAIARITAICICMLAFFLSPLGISTPLELSSHKVYEFLNPRIIYSIVILMAFILYKNYFFIMQKTGISSVAVKSIYTRKHMLHCRMYEMFLVLFGLWNIYYMNCFGNIMYAQRQLQHNVLYDLANDLNALGQRYPNLSRLYIPNNVRTPVMR